MKVEHPRTIGFFDVDSSFKLTFQAAARFFQDMATRHSDQLGAGFRQLYKKGVIWFLNRLEIEMISYPRLMDRVKLQTWSRKIEGVKGIREYLIASPNGTPLVKGTSVWLFFDVKKKRIAKVPEEIQSLYKTENESLFPAGPDPLEKLNKTDFKDSMDISLRYSDFDVNGHVNNTIYPGFLESMYHAVQGSPKPDIKNMAIRFEKEISPENKKVTIGWGKNEKDYVCSIAGSDIRFASAVITPSS